MALMLTRQLCTHSLLLSSRYLPSEQAAEAKAAAVQVCQTLWHEVRQANLKEPKESCGCVSLSTFAMSRKWLGSDMRSLETEVYLSFIFMLCCVEFFILFKVPFQILFAQLIVGTMQCCNLFHFGSRKLKGLRCSWWSC